MYWGQVAAGVAAAIGTAYWVHQSLGRPASIVIAAAVVAYAIVRWLLAWVYRTRYWHARGTSHAHRVECPNCHARRHRIGGDWILQCKRCGWKAGWPVVRWVTRSVPARQLKRTVVGPKLVLVVIAVAVIATGGVTLPDDLVTGLETDAPGGVTPTTDQPVGAALSSTPTERSDRSTRTPSPVATETPADGDNLAKAEQLIFEGTNDIRLNHSLNTLRRTNCLDKYALQHSLDMAEYGYSIRHGGPNGTSWEDRAQRIRSECGGALSENIAYGPASGNVYIYGTDETTRLSTPANMAEFAIRGWMNSPGHRENMIDDRWIEVGVGVATNGENIYFTIIFS